ncbi:MAG: PorV/PorQ family protein [Elusimicrobiota bacterium]|nr:MAG: PorV/PorQ family protein [Elusimicrobiota bacterium]
MRRAAAAAFLVLAGPAAAQESASFLTLGSGARAAAMSGAYVAAGDDSSAISWNPAGLAGAEREIQLTHREALAGARHEVLAAAVPWGKAVLGFQGAYLGHDPIPGRDAAGLPTGRYNASDLSAGLAVAVPLGRSGWRAGAGAKFVRSSIAEASARTYAFDAGTRWEPKTRDGYGVPMLGLAVRGLGAGLRYYDETTPLPLALAAGAGWRFPSGLLVGADYTRRPRATLKDEVAFGAERAIFPAFILRGGFSSSAARANGGGAASVVRGFTAGFGVRLGTWRLDYSLAPMGELGNAQTISVCARL